MSWVAMCRFDDFFIASRCNIDSGYILSSLQISLILSEIHHQLSYPGFEHSHMVNTAYHLNQLPVLRGVLGHISRPFTDYDSTSKIPRNRSEGTSYNSLFTSRLAMPKRFNLPFSGLA